MSRKNSSSKSNVAVVEQPVAGTVDLAAEALASVAPEVKAEEIMDEDEPVSTIDGYAAEVMGTPWAEAMAKALEASDILETLVDSSAAHHHLHTTVSALRSSANRIGYVGAKTIKAAAYHAKVGSKKGMKAEKKAQRLAKRIAELEKLGFVVAKAELAKG